MTINEVQQLSKNLSASYRALDRKRGALYGKFLLACKSFRGREISEHVKVSLVAEAELAKINSIKNFPEIELYKAVLNSAIIKYADDIEITRILSLYEGPKDLTSVALMFSKSLIKDKVKFQDIERAVTLLELA